MTIVSVFLFATVSPCAPHNSTSAVIIFARLAGDLDTIAASSAYSMLHIVDLRGVSSTSLTAKGVDRLRRGSVRSLSSAVLRTAVKMLNSVGRKNTPLAKNLADLKPFRHPSPIQSYTRSHPITKLAHDILPSSCNRRTTNIMSNVDLLGRNPHCDSGSRRSRSRYEPRRRATIFWRTLAACATREIPR